MMTLPSFVGTSNRLLRGSGLAGLAALSIGLTSCGGSRGSDSNKGGDPTLTIYAPQTLDGVELQIDDPNADTGGLATFQFTSLSRITPEQEIGTFTYINNSDTDIFADEIVNGTYSYEVVNATHGILALTGGTGSATQTDPVPKFVGDLNGIPLPLDFLVNMAPFPGPSPSFTDRVIVSLRVFPKETTTGRVSLLTGEPLPLNYNGKITNTTINPDIEITLHLADYTFTDASFEDRHIRFTRTGGAAGQETGTFIETPPEGSSVETPLSGTYSFVPDITGGNEAVLTLTDTNEGDIVLTLEYFPGAQGTTTSLDAPFDGAGPLPFFFQ